MARLRLNITALIGEDVAGKFLVVVDANAGLDHLYQKIGTVLRNSGVRATVEKVLNTSRHLLPKDEVLGEMLRDSEELVVVLRGMHGEQLHSRRLHEHHVHEGGPNLPPTMPVAVAPCPASSPLPSRPILEVAPTMAVAGGGASVPFSAIIRLPKEEEAPAMEEPAYPPPHEFIAPGGVTGSLSVPGPAEHFEDETSAFYTAGNSTRPPSSWTCVDHPVEAIAPRTYDNDWLVENMTPKLRDFLQEHRGEVTQEPQYVKSIGKYVTSRFHQRSGHYIAVFMRPQTGNGSDANATIPMHYNVAKADVLNFQRAAYQHMVKAQEHIEMFATTKRALRALLSKGMSEDDHVDVMLPVQYDSLQEAEGLQVEAERPLLPKIGGKSPVIIVDTSGPAGDHLMFIKAALKRALQTHIAGAKESFQLIGFSSTTGDVRMWSKGMQTPTEDAIRSAEAWIEALKPSPASCKLLNAVRYAIAHDDADTIYIISSGEAEKGEMNRHAILNGVRSLNSRQLAINTVGIQPDCEAEMLLRSIAEANWGDFIHKSFREADAKSAVSTADVRWTSWRTNLVNDRSNKLVDNFKKQKMSIGGQLKIIDVMEDEEKQRESLWLEEWKSAQRLLAGASRQRDDITDSDTLRDLERSGSRTLKVRVGGGFVHAQDEADHKLDQLFERRSAQPWTDRALTAAAGPAAMLPPKAHEAVDTRSARLPPSRQLPPEGVLPLLEPRARPSSGRRRSSRSRQTPSQSGKPPFNPWQSTSIGSLDGSRRHKASPTQYAPDASTRTPSTSSRRSRVASADKAAGGGRSTGGAPQTRPRRSKSPNKAAAKGASKSPARPASANYGGIVVTPEEVPQGAALPDVDAQGALDRRWSF
mmetsp:Transcript_34407/g.78429  ORF Transcript_34407/g.78429 Transcript_34407/m.78429 type:complete len:868 (+) Transcript_34407:49-2652(+)